MLNLKKKSLQTFDKSFMKNSRGVGGGSIHFWQDLHIKSFTHLSQKIWKVPKDLRKDVFTCSHGLSHYLTITW